jgi:hypothetical protein
MPLPQVRQRTAGRQGRTAAAGGLPGRNGQRSGSIQLATFEVQQRLTEARIRHGPDVVVGETGGTGRFAEARGTFTLERLAALAGPEANSGSTSGSFEGTISLR